MLERSAAAALGFVTVLLLLSPGRSRAQIAPGADTNSGAVAPLAPGLDPLSYPIWGVDVSHHQERIDWRTVAREPRMRFAFIKATQGTAWTDREFRRNWSAARRAGLRVGAYHYFSFCTPAKGQARHFLSVVPPVRDALPAVLDIEHLRNCAPDPDPAKVRAELRSWLGAVEAATGRKPMIYATADILAAYVDSSLDYPLWVRHTEQDPEPVLSLRWRLLQYDDQRACPGIQGPVDRDLFAGDEAAFAELNRPLVSRRHR